MSFEESATLAIAVLVLVTAALVVWCTILAMRLEAGLRRLSPEVKRDGNGRRLRERL